MKRIRLLCHLLIIASSVHHYFTEASDKSVLPAAVQRPFLALRDTVRAGSKDIQKFYEQTASISAVAYLLFGAAEPLSQASGSSNALLPYLTPIILRLYTSRPQRATSALSQQLYDLSWSLYGSSPSLRVITYGLPFTVLDKRLCIIIAVSLGSIFVCRHAQ
ncbi:hypothetical protein Vretimale_12148 [Volvox reticuliferus]|uniref:Uncharacterized protein n=1 Tax=Volvox reticuliferus TaxID=1737510 RepID=A0A8J4GIV5_9CHLO|nr:hypothetical protein Vretimale_12148 [Volvox reticuliferus]